MQERSQQSLDRMLDATEQLIRDHGADALTVAQVVKQAQASVGSFYARFEDKDALIRVVQDRVLTRLEQLLETRAPKAWSAPTIDECVMRFVTTMARDTENGPLFHAFLAQSTNDAVMRERGRRFGRKVAELFRGALFVHRNEIKHPRPDVAMNFAYASCIAVIERRLLWGRAAGTDDLGDEDLVRELARSTTAYLRSAEPSGIAATQPKKTKSRATRAT
jgi:AcrR family transcriptional regulator